MWLTNKYGDKSVTLSILWYGFCVSTFKLLVSGIQITDTFKFSDFGGGDYAAALGALGAVYQASKVIHNKYQTNNSEEDK